MNNEQIILGLLYKHSRTGYELNEVFKNIFSHFYDASFGMIYPTLRRLEKNGLVSKKWSSKVGDLIKINMPSLKKESEFLKTRLMRQWYQTLAIQTF